MLTEGGEGGDFPPKKSQSNTPVSGTTPATPTEYPAKKLARQLDFTTYGGASASVVLPEHPQQPAAQPLVMRPHVVQTVAQMQPPPPSSSSQLQSQQQVLSSPLQSQPSFSSRPPIKLESPKVRPRTTIEAKESTPKKQKQCNCKHSKCLKLYCECFASGIYCDGCNCVNCHNNVENEGARREAVDATLERNPNAFRPKIASSPHAVRDNREEVGEVLVLGKHNKGCHCKKSGCLKKYCECFQANILCSDLCKCMDCKNYEGSEERQALFHGDHANNLAFIQQAANAAITGAIGSSGYGTPPVSRKRKGSELFFGATAKDPVLHRLAPYPQGNHIKASGHSPSTSSIPISRASNSTVGPSKFTYRSLLADMIQPHDVKELVSVLVVYAAEAAKIQSEERNEMEMEADDRTGSSATSAAQDQLSQNEAEVGKAGGEGGSSSGNQADKSSSPKESNSDGTDVSKERPMSPGTLALMCDEEDTMFTATAAAKGLVGPGFNTTAPSANGQGMSEVYAEQERTVLTKFRDCLNRLITYGEMKETKYSSLARTEIGDQQDLFSNGTIHARAETRNQQEPFANGVARSTFLPTPMSLQMNTTATSAAPNITRTQNIIMSPAKPGL